MPKHPFENTSEGGPTYEELSNVISIEGLSWEPNRYLDDELNILQPRLVAVGYTEIEWGPGEHDSFGPLTRTCTARDAAGEVRAFIYG